MIEINNLCAFYKKKPCLIDINFSIQHGEIVCIVGESGCGKSTFLNIITGLIPINCLVKYSKFNLNKKTILKYNADKVLSFNTNKVGYVSQKIIESFDPSQKIATHLVLSGQETYIDEIKMLLSILGIQNVDEVLKKYPSECSIGMLQRINICNALLSKPDILILDEATTGIDSINQYKLLTFLRDYILQHNITCIIATHDLRVARLLSSKIYIMLGGTFIENGTTNEIFTNPLHPYTKTLVNSYNTLILGDNKNQNSWLSTKIAEINSMCSFLQNCTHQIQMCTQQRPPTTSAFSHEVRCWQYHNVDLGDI